MRTLTRKSHVVIGRQHNGVLMTPEEFDAIEDYDERYCYELINRVLVVNPVPSYIERDLNDELGHWLRNYQQRNPGFLDKTVYGQYVTTAVSRRRADRVIWAGLGRGPDPDSDLPAIVVEFVSRRRRDELQDYIDKRDEYLAIGVSEYWIINRFKGTLTVFRRGGDGVEERTVSDREVYKTPLLPGFELPLGKLLAVCDTWKKTTKKKSSKRTDE